MDKRSNVEDGEWRIRQEHQGTSGVETCSWCGSVNPAALVAAIQAGCHIHLADQKYGWPHKWYIDKLPCREHYRAEGGFPVPAEVIEKDASGQATYYVHKTYVRRHNTMHAKFYTRHIIDATDEEFAIIDQYMQSKMGLRLTVDREKNEMLYQWVPRDVDLLPETKPSGGTQ